MYEVFERLLKEKGLKASHVAKATEITPSTFTDWKNGRSSPKIDKLLKIANYFGVSLEYLLTDMEESDGENQNCKSSASNPL